MWQEAPAEMENALYQVVNQVIQKGQMPTSWEGKTYLIHPKKSWQAENLKINTSYLPHEHSCQNSSEHLGQTTLQQPTATIGT